MNVTLLEKRGDLQGNDIGNGSRSRNWGMAPIVSSSWTPALLKDHEGDCGFCVPDFLWNFEKLPFESAAFFPHFLCHQTVQVRNPVWRSPAVRILLRFGAASRAVMYNRDGSFQKRTDALCTPTPPKRMHQFPETSRMASSRSSRSCHSPGPANAWHFFSPTCHQTRQGPGIIQAP